MNKQFRYRAKCLKCDYEEAVVKETKEECKTIDVCPACGDGAYVDLFYYYRYKKEDAKSKLNVHVSLNADINKLQLKLRAIATHAESLANELNNIDNLEPCEKCAECRHVIYQRC